MTWAVLAPIVSAAAGLLVISGVPKVRNPQPLRRALRSVGVTVPLPVVRVLAMGFVLVGLWALAMPSVFSVLTVAILYGGFTVFLALALRRGGVVESCGCFGRADTPPTAGHLAVTGAAALVCTIAASANPTGWTQVGLADTVVIGAGALLIGFLAWQVMAVAPTVTPAAIRSIKGA